LCSLHFLLISYRSQVRSPCSRYCAPPYLHSFPTRRSSDLPARVVRDLEALGVDAGGVLHIRSFLDHDRPYRAPENAQALAARLQDRKSTRLNSSHVKISYAVFCLKKKKTHAYI